MKAGSAGSRLGSSLACAIGRTGDRRRRPAGTQSSGGKSVLRIGWAQDPRTLNPFVGLDEEDYNVWAINWDLLVNFSPEDLSPAPGIAKSWTVSEDKKTVTFKLDPDAKWSDGKPITSADVKWSLEVLGDEGTLFTNYTQQRHLDRHARPVHGRRSTPRGPTRGSSAASSSTSCPKHIWGKVPIKDLTGTYKPELPLVGSGPYIVTEYEQRADRPNGAQPELPRRPSRPSTRSSSSSTATRTRSSARCSSARSTWCVEVSAGELRAARRPSPTSRRSRSSSPAYTELAFNLCPAQLLPRRRVQPGRPGPRRCARRSPTRSTASASTRSPPASTSFVAHGILPEFYKSFYEVPEQDYPLRPRHGQPDPRRRRLDDGRRRGPRPRTARRSSSTSTCARSRRTTSRRRS